MSKYISVPFLPHLKKFLLLHHKVSEPVPVRLNSLLGKITYSTLISKKQVTKSNDRYDDTIMLEFSQDINNLEKRISSLIKINEFYDKFFKDVMIGWILAQDEVGIAPYASIQSFLRKYGITEKEYALETAYRHWQRYKNSEYHSLQQ